MIPVVGTKVRVVVQDPLRLTVVADQRGTKKGWSARVQVSHGSKFSIYFVGAWVGLVGAMKR